jgi:ABC-type Zn uptake system ZnuABC Zn-binding protein ZnuA
MLRVSRRRIRTASAIAVLWLVACTPVGQAPEGEPTAAMGSEPYLTPPDAIRPIPLQSGEKLHVVATTSVLADVVGQVGGEAISLTTLIPAGVDPHAFEPTPRAARELAAADVVFISGFGLEEFMADLLVQAGGEAYVVSASLGIEPLAAGDLDLGDGAAGPTTGGGTSADARFVDPHTWFDPNNVIHWTENIETALAAVDPENAELYAQNAAAYRKQLVALDAEIRQAVAEVPPAERRLVTDHEELAYFADEYGFEIVGSVLPSTSSLAEPSAQDLGALFDKVRAEGVPAIFVTAGSNDALARRLAEDAGVRLVTLYGHSLTGPEGPAPSYLDLMRYNARTIAEALMP